MPELRKLVIELLGQLGSSREARQYLKQFASQDETRFAVVKVGGGVLADDLESLVSALAFLHRLGLHPIIVHGAGPQLDQAMADAGVATERKNGLRVTSDEAMAVIRPVIYRENLRLVDALEGVGVRARGIQHGVFECDYLDRDQLGLVGRVDKVDLESLRGAVRAGAMPVVACLGESPSGQVLNINADAATVSLVEAIQPSKIIFLTPTGGLLDQAGRVISAVSLSSDYDSLMAQDWVHSGMRLKLEMIRGMLDQLPPSASVSITSPQHLTRELFTHTGAGTLVRRGEPIRIITEPGEVDQAALCKLLESSFGRQLSEQWFGGLALDCVMLTASHRGAAVLTRSPSGVPYLDKFVVTPEAQGEGVGAALWQAIRARCPALYWRSRLANPITSWYYQQAEASLREGEWVAFTLGVDGSQREQLLQDALSRQSGWLESPPEGTAP